MRGGGRRSPPLTRRTSGGEVPHFEHPPARVNAGYNAVNRGLDGKFVSCHGGANVQRMVAASSDHGSRHLEGGISSMEGREHPSPWIPEAFDGADSGSLLGRQQPQAMGDVLDVNPLEAKICGNVALSGLEPLLPSIVTSSPPYPATIVGIDGMDLEKENGSSLCTAAVCVNVHNNISSSGAENVDQIASNRMEDGCVLHNTSSPSHPHHPTVVEGCVVDDEMVDPNSIPAHNVAVQHRDSKPKSHINASFSAWSKPGVSPLPSLKDLPHLQPLDGAARLDEEEVNSYISRFDGALVGRLFGRHIPFFHLNVELQRRWDRFGNFKLMTLSNECFICFFDNIKARDAVLMGGPWIIAGQVIGLDKWTPGFSQSTSHGFITPIWIRLPDLPFYCWGLKNLASICSLLGEPLWVDDATLNLSKGAYARVCIKIDLSQPLQPYVSIIGREGTFKQQIEYEGLSAFCNKCGRVGHKMLHCNPTLAAGGRMEVGRNSHYIMNKAKSIGRTPIFAFSATKKQSEPTWKGKNIAAQPASTSNIITPSATVQPPQAPQSEVDHDGAGPWKIVPPRRRGRRLQKQYKQENVAVHVNDNNPSSSTPQQMHVQEADPHPTDLDQLPDSPGHNIEEQTVPKPHEDMSAPSTKFSHKPALFTVGSGAPLAMHEKQSVLQEKLTPITHDRYVPIDETGRFKKRKPVNRSNVEDAASHRPP